jgi:hypothetical protein
MMDVVRTTETSVNFNVTTRRYIPEDSRLQQFQYFHMLRINLVLKTER